MKLIIYNGSPRGKNSNTKILMDEFMKGIYTQGKYQVEVYNLASRSHREAGIQAYASADKVIIAFPLYTDSMPGIVKEFIEKLSIYDRFESNPDMGFVVQSGFPEPAHSRHIEKYLEKLAGRLNAKYLGCAVKGGVEGIQVMPGWMTRRIRRNFFKLGINFNKLGALDRNIIKNLAPRDQLSKFQVRLYKLMSRIGMTNMYWNKNLKDNNAYDIRFASPYGQPRKAQVLTLLHEAE